jgi:UDP-hydrolysing UDP-N-acetyl-D-glucosamine 2-epimerase
MRQIGVVTTSRADYGLLLPVLKRIRASRELELRLFVSGTHLSGRHGMTVREIEADGFAIAARVPLPLGGNTPEAVAKAMGRATSAFAGVYERLRPDILLILGDRFEMHAAASAAVPFGIPLAHIHGGEITLGAMDDQFRHSLTKLSHLHFAATKEYAGRIIGMGEEPWRVTVSGAPGLDNLRAMRPLSRRQLECRYGIDLSMPSILVTFHPVTLEQDNTEIYIDRLLEALGRLGGCCFVFTAPNADPGASVIRKRILRFVGSSERAFLVENFGTHGYLSMMSRAAAMAGNSSSGILEAASFRLPVVNIGTRQEGRTRGRNVIDTGYGARQIGAAIGRALSKEFRASLRGLKNPYGDGFAAERIVSLLAGVDLERLIPKRFHGRITGNLAAVFQV